MILLVALATLQLVLNQRALSSTGFMLHRAEISYRQLDAYQQLAIDTLEYIVSAGRAGVAPEVMDHQRQVVAARLRGLDQLTTFEVELVHENGGDESNLVERARLGRIRSTIETIFEHDRSGPSGLSAKTYQDVLKPMMTEAIGGEQAEIALVEQSMREMQANIRWLGGLAILAEVTTAVVVLGLFKRAVLDPLNRLVLDIREFGRGRLSHRVVVSRHDEFGLLAQHVNRMARQLDRRTVALLDLNDRLEATVADRTRALTARNEELRDIDESRRRFFVDVSHELRTPLTAIVGEADVTLRDPRSDVVGCREALSSILANSTYLNRRIDDLMALARSSSGRLDLEREILDLNLVTAEAMAEVHSLAKVNRVIARFEPLAYPVYVEGDRKRLRQCLMILLDNAVKFSRASQVVEVVLDVRGPSAAMTVVDQGNGIAARDLPSIFERFYQAEVGRRAGGTGLGLAIAHRIVEAHGGDISAASREQGGTAVTMTLPLQKGAGQ